VVLHKLPSFLSQPVSVILILQEKDLTLHSTVAGKNDAENIRGIYAVKPAMQRFKPLIVVLENTSGLANMKKNMGYFHILLREMMEAGPGYNVRWEIMNTMDHGVPQHRKRLFIIASRSVYTLVLPYCHN
jgi:site-specific DNA-cytosine methylase